MTNETYIIDYGVYLKTGHYESGTMKVKNCMSELHAKVKLEVYLKKKHAEFKQMVVYKCHSDMFSVFGGFFRHPK